MNSEKKICVIFSGGLDSTVLLYKAVALVGKENVMALSLYYGQKHNVELYMARYSIGILNVPWEQIDISSVFKSSQSSLVNDEIAVYKGSYEQYAKDHPGENSTAYVEFRNGLFLSIAASVALSKGYNTLWYGAHLGDTGVVSYPDCSWEFVDSMNKAISIGSGNKLVLEAPFISSKYNKSDIVKEGNELKVEFEYTWSCYNGAKEHCGECSTCIERKKAFVDAGVKDPTIYKSNEPCPIPA